MELTRRNFVLSALAGAGIILVDSIPILSMEESIKEFSVDEVMNNATKIKVDINKITSINVHSLDNNKHGRIFINLDKTNAYEFVKYTRQHKNTGVLVPLSNLSKKDIENCIIRSIKELKNNKQKDGVFTYKYKFYDKILHIEPESIFFISNKIYGYDNYEYANVVIFEEGLSWEV